MKLTENQKIEIYWKRKNGEILSSLSKEYGVNELNIKYFVYLTDVHGLNVVKHDFHHYFS